MSFTILALSFSLAVLLTWMVAYAAIGVWTGRPIRTGYFVRITWFMWAVSAMGAANSAYAFFLRGASV